MSITSQSNELLKEIQQFKSLDEWWMKCILAPVMKSFWPQLLALIFIEFGIIYTHNWLAALLCFVLMVSKIYHTICTLTHHLLHGFLALQIRKSSDDIASTDEIPVL